ncbi:polysaccharide lyase [Pedobacter sp. BMA]|uniref:polysaccharide lyase n=1 Tax=Pedobacter sp. BMA TaxID=1663685 RepID=UPI000649B12B|nr:hypothetical protein [Pedobacter sp. BMA]KLT65636.1 hypothetical protein AB669_11255 [Pedobacter sp. BMA]
MKKTPFILLLATLAAACKNDVEKLNANQATSLEISAKDDAVTSAAAAETVYDTRTIDFTRTNGGYPLNYWITDFGNDNAANSGSSSLNTSEISRLYTESNTLRVKLLANKIGDDGGMWSNATIGRSTTKKVLQYDVKFGYVTVPFEWGWGGKIPGLGGGATYTGCVITTDGNGWTSRVMWKTDDAGEAYLMPYVYYVDKPKTCGDDFGAKYYGGDGTGLKPGKWYRVRMEVTLNTAANTNGILKITISENNSGTWSTPQTLINKTNIRYATTTAGREIDELITGVYRGGSTTDWAASVDDYIFLDKIILTN